MFSVYFAAPGRFRWYADKSCDEVIHEREEMIQWIEQKGQELWCDPFSNYDPCHNLPLSAGAVAHAANGAQERVPTSER